MHRLRRLRRRLHECAVALTENGGPVIDRKRCLDCGKCVIACPSGTLAMGKKDSGCSWGEGSEGIPGSPMSLMEFFHRERY